MCGTAGYDGTVQEPSGREIRHPAQQDLAQQHPLQTNISNTRSDVAHLIKVLVDIARDIGAARPRRQGGQEALAARVKYLMEDVPELPNFSRFEDVFRERRDSATTEGDMRAAFYAAYGPAGCEHVKLASKDIDERLEKGPERWCRPASSSLPARLSDHGAGPSDHRRDDRVHAQARCQRDPRLQRRARAQAPEAVGIEIRGKRKSKND